MMIYEQYLFATPKTAQTINDYLNHDESWQTQSNYIYIPREKLQAYSSQRERRQRPPKIWTRASLMKIALVIYT